MPTETVPQMNLLLTTMHDIGIQLKGSSDPVLRRWGEHLLSDWRSLDLYEQRGQES